uniref:Uncharacterized protein n=1 Tax=Setaria viridis TaxID=4556 RepID=A0A4U6TBA8_SETVI|nr:hypothetical protein SEVIR_9G288175v2 [Setaria viridis]
MGSSFASSIAFPSVATSLARSITPMSSAATTAPPTLPPPDATSITPPFLTAMTSTRRASSPTAPTTTKAAPSSSRGLAAALVPVPSSPPAPSGQKLRPADVWISSTLPLGFVKQNQSRGGGLHGPPYLAASSCCYRRWAHNCSQLCPDRRTVARKRGASSKLRLHLRGCGCCRIPHRIRRSKHAGGPDRPLQQAAVAYARRRPANSTTRCCVATRMRGHYN